jgi:hypothetical protein
LGIPYTLIPANFAIEGPAGKYLFGKFMYYRGPDVLQPIHLGYQEEIIFGIKVYWRQTYENKEFSFQTCQIGWVYNSESQLCIRNVFATKIFFGKDRASEEY